MAFKLKDFVACNSCTLIYLGRVGTRCPHCPRGHGQRLSKGKSKYGAVRTKVGEIVFDSKKEAARYGELKLLEQSGCIENLEVHPVYNLVVNGHHVCAYEADFRYVEDDKLVVEDVKSEPTRMKQSYRIKKKLVRALFGIDIKET